jgi:hypothetical protein
VTGPRAKTNEEHAKKARAKKTEAFNAPSFALCGGVTEP